MIVFAPIFYHEKYRLIGADNMKTKHNLLKKLILFICIMGSMPGYSYSLDENLLPDVDFISTISENGSDRGTAYCMSNKIITAGGKVFLGWLDYPGVKVREYSICGNNWNDTVELSRDWDNHKGPALTKDSEGYLYTIFGAHGSPFKFRKSSFPLNASSWEMERKPDGASDMLEIKLYGNTNVYMARTGLLTDDDYDHTIDIVEQLLYGSVDYFKDTDADTVPDVIEKAVYGSLTVNITAGGILRDADSDGIPDIEEKLLNDNLDSTTIDNADADQDGVSDALEILMYGNTSVNMLPKGLNTDTDNDDDMTDIVEYLLYGSVMAFNGSSDTDNDTVPDDIERAIYGSLSCDMRPGGILTDSDMDGYPDIIEKILNGNLNSSVISGYEYDNDEVVIGVKATYPSLVIDQNDTLHLLYREHDYGCYHQHEYACAPGMIYRHKEKGGEWSPPIALAWCGNMWHYTQFGNILTVSRDGTLHAAFEYNDENDVLGFGYLRSTDGGNTWENINGVTQTLPIDPSNTDCMIDVREKYYGLLRVNGIVVDNDGEVYVSIVDSPDYHVIWHHDGTGWRKHDLLAAVRSVFPGAYPSSEYSHGTISIGMGGRILYSAMGGYIPGVSTRCLFILASKDKAETFQVKYIPVENSFGPYGLSLEKPFNSEPLEGVPSVVYHNTDIPSKVTFVRLKPAPIEPTPGKEGDIDGDGFVNVKDLIIVAIDFGKTSGFNPACDLAADGRIDIKDLLVVAINYGGT